MTSEKALEELNQTFALDDRLRFQTHPSGLVQGIIKTSKCEASFFLHGAHVASFRPADEEMDVLFMSGEAVFAEGKAIRGGVPVCFPWFAGHPTDPKAPAHGLVRTVPWTLTKSSCSDETVVVRLELDQAPWQLTFDVSFGQQLLMQMRIHNQSDTPATCELALHTYFQLADSASAKVFGLESLPSFDKVMKQQVGPLGHPVSFASEVDQIFFGGPEHLRIHDPASSRWVHIEPTNSQSTVVWNPWVTKSANMADFGDDEYKRMCCVETARVATNRMEVRPGQSTNVGVNIWVDRE